MENEATAADLEKESLKTDARHARLSQEVHEKRERELEVCCP